MDKRRDSSGGGLVEQMKNGEGTCVKGGLVGKCLVSGSKVWKVIVTLQNGSCTNRVSDFGDSGAPSCIACSVQQPLAAISLREQGMLVATSRQKRRTLLSTGVHTARGATVSGGETNEWRRHFVRK